MCNILCLICYVYLIEHEFEVLQIQYMEVIQDVIVYIHNAFDIENFVLNIICLQINILLVIGRLALS